MTSETVNEFQASAFMDRVYKMVPSYGVMYIICAIFGAQVAASYFHSFHSSNVWKTIVRQLQRIGLVANTKPKPPLEIWVGYLQLFAQTVQGFAPLLISSFTLATVASTRAQNDKVLETLFRISNRLKYIDTSTSTIERQTRRR